MNNKEIYQVTYLIQETPGTSNFKISPEKTISLLFEAESFSKVEDLWFERRSKWYDDDEFRNNFYVELIEIKKLGIIHN